MQVEDLMSGEVICIDKNRRLSDAARLIEKKKFSRVVVTSDGKLCGILTEKNIMKHLGSAKHGDVLPTSLHVSTAMACNPISIKKEADIEEAVKLMVENGISSIPVVQGKEIIGIITKTDLMKAVTNSKVKLKEIMSKKVFTVIPDDRIVHARRVMLDNGISRVVVLEGDKLIGMVTEKDAARALFAFRKVADKYQYSRIRNVIVEDVMTQNVKTLGVDATAGDAATLMLENNFSGVPLVNKGKLVGIVTKTDLVKLI